VGLIRIGGEINESENETLHSSLSVILGTVSVEARGIELQWDGQKDLRSKST